MAEAHPAKDVPGKDVVDFLVEQHDEVRTLLRRVTASTGGQRQAAFDALRELLARHETAEELVLRPMTQAVPDGSTIAQARMDEENSAKRDLAALEKLDAGGQEFETSLAAFSSVVLAHADSEERIEFAALRLYTDTALLLSAREKVAKAERHAPTIRIPARRRGRETICWVRSPRWSTGLEMPSPGAAEGSLALRNRKE
jgi:hypothetical protein